MFRSLNRSAMLDSIRAAGDLDKDGLLDIAVARSDAPNVVYFGSH